MVVCKLIGGIRGIFSLLLLPAAGGELLIMEDREVLQRELRRLYVEDHGTLAR